MKIPGISDEEMEAARKAFLEDMKKDREEENDRNKVGNNKSGKPSKKTSKSNRNRGNLEEE